MLGSRDWGGEVKCPSTPPTTASREVLKVCRYEFTGNCMLKKIALLVVFFSLCTTSFAQVVSNPASARAEVSAEMDDPQPPTDGPTFACEDVWKEVNKGSRKEWQLSCNTGFCGVGGTGDTCEPTGKTKDGKPTCECVKKAVPPPNNGKCRGRAVCGGKCTKKDGGAGVCRVMTIPRTAIHFCGCGSVN